MKGKCYAEDLFGENRSIANGELYLCTQEDEIVAAMVLSHHCNEGYRKFQWKTKATKNEITLIHALGVHPEHSGQGYAKAMVKYAIETAKHNRQKALRLDMPAGNIPAEKLYTSLGFQYMDTLQMYYEDTGRTDYKLYEYVLS